MKNFLFLAVMALSWVAATANNNIGWVYLNNGNIVKGVITQTDTKVFISTDDGSELSYPMLEVNKISYKAPKMPKVGIDPDLKDMADYETGFWCSAQLNAGYTVMLDHHNSPWTEVDFSGGYRFNQFLKIGLGLGCRYYCDNSRLRHKDIRVAFPLYVTVMGNILRDTYRTVTPYYSFDIGGAICDGFMWRPSLGIRVGQSRSAFLVALVYTGQSLRYITGNKNYVSSLGLSVGYEF